MSFFKKRMTSAKPEASLNGEAEKNNGDKAAEPVLVATIVNAVSSGIFQDMLKENGIPFVCRQRGAGGYLKILFGGGVVPDEIYVAGKNYEKADELYQVYINSEAAFEELPEDDSEDDGDGR